MAAKEPAEKPDLVGFDRDFSAEKGISLLCGVDEAGRGPLAGAVYAAACILPAEYDLPGLNDSKQLSEKKRDKLFDAIKEQAIAYYVATASVEEIEQLDIRKATMLAMTRAVQGLSVKPEFTLIDGNFVPPQLQGKSQFLIGGDAHSASIAAASILAKVSRDRYMQQLHEQYPEYAFDKHKGYGTALHYRRIEKYGVCPEHRLSFLKKKLADWGEMPPQTLGFLGEHYAAEYLTRKGYTILERNYQTRQGELDIVAQKEGVICFVEVKSRKTLSPEHLPKEAVTFAKQKRIIEAAKDYIAKQELDAPFRFDVAEVVRHEGKILVHLIPDAFAPQEYY
jgi:uncharacterized protein (TIGR00252 family)